MPVLAPPPTATEVLIGARRLLRDGYLLQGTLYDNRGGYCLGGALIIAGGRPPAPLTGAVNEAARRLVGSNGMPDRPFDGVTPAWGSMVAWNNAPGRTKEEVLEALDRALAA